MKLASSVIARDSALVRQAERDGIAHHDTTFMRQAQREPVRQAVNGLNRDEGLDR